MTPEQSMLMTDNGFPRRNRTDLWTEAEAAIQHAVDVCERTIPADPLETDAIILLGDARNKIGELVDREIAAGRMLMPSRPAGGPNVMCPQCGCDVIEGLREDVRSGVADKDEVGLLAALESLSSSPSSTTATPDGLDAQMLEAWDVMREKAIKYDELSALPSSRALSEEERWCDVLPVNGGYMCLTHRVDFDVDNVPESCARTNWHIPRDRLTGAPK